MLLARSGFDALCSADWAFRCQSLCHPGQLRPYACFRLAPTSPASSSLEVSLHSGSRSGHLGKTSDAHFMNHSRAGTARLCHRPPRACMTQVRVGQPRIHACLSPSCHNTPCSPSRSREMKACDIKLVRRSSSMPPHTRPICAGRHHRPVHGGAKWSCGGCSAAAGQGRRCRGFEEGLAHVRA